MDPSSASNYEDFVTRHFHLDFEPDFEEKVIKANCTLTMERLNMEATSILVDTSKLHIIRVHQDNNDLKVIFCIFKKSFLNFYLVFFERSPFEIFHCFDHRVTMSRQNLYPQVWTLYK